MAYLNVLYLESLIAVYHWSDAQVAREMGISAAHFCEVKSGKRSVTIDFVDLLMEALHIYTYDRVLVHPSSSRYLNARRRLEMVKMNDGRPWPTAYGKGGDDPLTSYGRMKKEKLESRRAFGLNSPKGFVVGEKDA